MPTDPTTAPRPAARVTQRDAVRLALTALGNDAPNADIIRWVREQHGYNVAQYISQLKNAARRTAGLAKGRPGRRTRPAAPTAAPITPPAPAAARVLTPPARGLADDLTALARLAAKYGADEVRGMLGALEAAAAVSR